MTLDLKKLFPSLSDDEEEKRRKLLELAAKVEMPEIPPAAGPTFAAQMPMQVNPTALPTPFVPAAPLPLPEDIFRGGGVDQVPYQMSPQDEGLFRSLGKPALPVPEMAEAAPPPPTWKDKVNNARTSSEISGLAAELPKYKDEHKHSLFGRLFKGIAKGYQQWNGQGGLLGLAAASLGSGIGSAVSPKIYEGLERKGLEKKLFRKLGVAQKQEEFDAKQATEQAQAANYQNQIKTRTANTISQINDRSEDNEREARRRTVVERNGKYYNRDSAGNETPLLNSDGAQAVELTKIPIATSLRDGTPIYTTGDKALDREITENLNQARMDFDADKLNQADLDQYEKDVVQWATESNEHQMKVSKLDNEGQEKQNEAAEYERQAAANPDDAPDLMAKAAKARAEGRALVLQGNEARSKGPKKPTRPSANLSAPNLKVGTYSESDFVKRAKDRGITGDALAAAIAQAKRDGVIK